MIKPDRESEIRRRWAGMCIGQDSQDVNCLLAMIDHLRFMLEESKKTIVMMAGRAERMVDEVECHGMEYREDGDPWRWRNTRALNAECDADKLEKIAEDLAAAIGMIETNARVMAGAVGVRAWEGDFVRREKDAAMFAWSEYQKGFKHRGEKDE